MSLNGEIPIIVTKWGKNGLQFSFKMLGNEQLKQMRNRRNKTTDKYPLSEYHPPMQTLEHDRLTLKMNRNRRISSSGASKRFPKDFFNDECLLGFRKSKRKIKYEDQCLITGFNQVEFQEQKQSQPLMNFKVMHPLHRLRQFKSKVNEVERVETPKFKHREVPKENNSKPVPTEYLSHNKTSQANPKLKEHKYNLSDQPIEESRPSTDRGQLQPMSNTQGEQSSIPVSQFNLTLGKKTSLSYLLFKEQAKKESEESQKEQPEKENFIGHKKQLKSSRGMLWRRPEGNQGFRIRKYIPN